jgi:hypothetical protein
MLLRAFATHFVQGQHFDHSARSRTWPENIY